MSAAIVVKGKRISGWIVRCGYSVDHGGLMVTQEIAHNFGTNKKAAAAFYDAVLPCMNLASRRLEEHRGAVVYCDTTRALRAPKRKRGT